MLENVEVLYHSSIRINGNIYFDPFKIDKVYNNAQIVFITHSHYDHFSIEDIKKVYNKDTKFVVPKDIFQNLIEFGINKDNILVVTENQNYSIDGLNFTTVPAYNNKKQFHPKQNHWLGYIVKIDDVSYYIAGDTDENEDNLKVKCDVALVPIGGTYTMDYMEAASFINKINPKFVIPTHYNSIVGKKEDGIKFKNLINDNIKCKLYL